MDQSEKRKEIGKPLILCLFRMGVLDGGLKVKVLGGILSMSHQVIGKVIQETPEKADGGSLTLSRGPGQEPHQVGPRCAGAVSRLWSVRVKLNPLCPGPHDKRGGVHLAQSPMVVPPFSIQLTLVICGVNAAFSEARSSLCFFLAFTGPCALEFLRLVHRYSTHFPSC